MNAFNQYFDINAYFCAGDDGSGGQQRFLKGTISDYYVRMGKFDGTMIFVALPSATLAKASNERNFSTSSLAFA